MQIPSITLTHTNYWTASDLELFECDRLKSYELIAGELIVNHPPTWRHQAACIQIGRQLGNWVAERGSGQVAWGPGIAFSDTDIVIPDIVWASDTTLANFLDDKDRLTSAPELVIEIFSVETPNRHQKVNSRVKLYSSRGVREYWLYDYLAGFVAIYRREGNVLNLTETLFSDDTLTSPLLPGFSCNIANFLT